MENFEPPAFVFGEEKLIIQELVSNVLLPHISPPLSLEDGPSQAAHGSTKGKQRSSPAMNLEQDYGQHNAAYETT